MLSKVGIICFAGSYLVALALEITRLLFRSGIRRVVMLGFAAAGLFAHTAYLYYQGWIAQGSPLSSMRDWYFVAAWALVAVYLLLACFRPKTPFGLILLPLVLALIAIGAFVANPAPIAPQMATSVWGTIHAASIVLCTVALFIGFAAGLMYFHQAKRLKNKLPPPGGLSLPSLEWLQQANSRSLVVAVLMMGVGVASGAILNRIASARGDGRLAWNDPLVLATTLMFVWLAIAAAFGAWYKPARQSRRVVYLTLVSFLFLVIALAVGLFFPTKHGPKPPPDHRNAVRVTLPSVAAHRLPWVPCVLPTSTPTGLHRVPTPASLPGARV
jgi:hypothetical protein